MTGNDVLEVYSDNPYPSREPEEERKRLIRSPLGHMRIVNSVFWGGKRELGRGFRVLDAGCGTGNCSIYVAEQLKDTGAEVVALDFSKKAVDIVKERAKVRGLTNISFSTASILDLPELGLGSFDFIVCAGVLQHFESTEQGLGILASALKDDGGMGIQINAKYGRHDVRTFLDAVNLINKGGNGKRAMISDAKLLYDSLPKDHWFKRREYEELAYDVGAYSRDLTVPELYRIIRGSGLGMVRFMNSTAYEISVRYPDMPSPIRDLPKEDKEALCEALDSTMSFHRFFVTRKGYTPPSISPGDEGVIPCFAIRAPSITISGGFANALVFSPYGEFTLSFEKRLSRMLELIDGKRTVGSIIDTVSGETGMPRKEASAAWLNLYNKTAGVELLALNLP